MAHVDTLTKIAETLTDIDIEELTTAEKRIASILEKEDFLEKKTTEDETIYIIKEF